MTAGSWTPLAIALLVLIVKLAWCGPTHAEEPASGPLQKAPSSVQEQLDALKKGQEQILQELEALRAMLPQNTAKSEIAARPSATNLTVLNVHGEPFRGESKARFAIVEYSDFNCPYCAKYARQVFPQVEEKLIKTGKIKYYFRDFPAPDDPPSAVLARAARCAGEQGKFWQMHDHLFASENKAEREDVDFQAQAIGLDLEHFKACMLSGHYSEAIKRSAATARRIGIRGTPAFVVGKLSDDGEVVFGSDVLIGVDSCETIEKALAELTAPKPAETEH
jgi:protein-disulfide isomerase